MMVVFLILLVFLGVPAAAEVGAGIEAMPFSTGDKETIERDPHDTVYVQKLSKSLKADASTLQDLQHKGFGRSEMIRLVWISQRSKKPVEELVKKLGKKKTVDDLAAEFGMDNAKLRQESLILRDAITAEMAAMSPDELQKAASAQLLLPATGQNPTPRK